MTRPSILPLALSLALLAACDGDPSGPSAGPAHQVRVTYTGPVAGEFDAVGIPDLGRMPIEQTFATGYRSEPDDALEVTAYMTRPDGRTDMTWITLPAAAVGTHAIPADCPSLECASVKLPLGLPRTFGQARYSCRLTAGTITVAQLDGDRARGSVNGTGECISDTGETLRGFAAAGTFDVKVYHP